MSEGTWDGTGRITELHQRVKDNGGLEGSWFENYAEHALQAAHDLGWTTREPTEEDRVAIRECIDKASSEHPDNPSAEPLAFAAAWAMLSRGIADAPGLHEQLRAWRLDLAGPTPFSWLPPLPSVPASFEDQRRELVSVVDQRLTEQDAAEMDATQAVVKEMVAQQEGATPEALAEHVASVVWFRATSWANERARIRFLAQAFAVDATDDLSTRSNAEAAPPVAP